MSYVLIPKKIGAKKWCIARDDRDIILRFMDGIDFSIVLPNKYNFPPTYFSSKNDCASSAHNIGLKLGIVVNVIDRFGKVYQEVRRDIIKNNYQPIETGEWRLFDDDCREVDAE